MAGYFKAVAVDYDGTLTLDGELADGVLAGIEETRASEVRVILVTGRVLSDLRSLVPRVEDLLRRPSLRQPATSGATP